VVEQVLLDRVPVESGDGGQPPGYGGTGPPGVLELTGEQFDVGPAGREQPQVTSVAPGGELAQIQGVRFAVQAAVCGQEPG
jgi:hypothetical protein